MNRSFDVQLQVALRALGEVVAPALAGAEKHVVEQLHLSIATLSFVKARLPEARRFHRMELQSYIDLARDAATLARPDLPEQAEALLESAAAGAAVLMDAEADLPAYEAAGSDLRDRLAQLVHACSAAPCRKALERLILDRSEAIMLQSRQWCVPLGFELKPEDLPPPAW
ncbi:MAG: hypothetical protein V4579_08650 [Pseudomonadota bacterium]